MLKSGTYARLSAVAFTVAALSGRVAVAAGAAAQPSDTAVADVTLEEIIVTAEHRSENLQSAAVAIDAVSAKGLATANVTNLEEMSRLIPSLQVGRAAGAANLFFLRGVGSNATVSLTDPAIAVNYDGEFQARQYGGNGQFYDLERVEVLKGPQGTLYGRNATGGVINIITAHPDFTYAGSATLTGGNYGLEQVTGWLNVPLADTIATRASFQTIRHSGYLSDGQADEDSQAARLQFRFDPSENLSINLAGDYIHMGGLGGGNAIANNGYTVDQRIGLTDSRVQAVYLSNPTLRAPKTTDLHSNNHFEGLHASINWITQYGTLTVIPAVRSARLDYAAITGEEDIQTETDHQSSLETRFSSNDGGRATWVAGAFYLKDNIDTIYGIDNLHALTVASATTQAGLSPSGLSQIYGAGTDTKAAFGDMTFKMVEGFRLIGGVRYTSENKTAKGSLLPFVTGLGSTTLVNGYPVVYGPAINIDGDTTWTSTSWRAGAQVDLAERSMIYATVATGFHSGGFFFTADDPTYQPEKITAYTLGSKNRFADNRLQVNAEAFYWKYKNQQLSHVTQDSLGNFVFATENAGSSTIKGAELQVALQAARNTLLNAQVQYLDTVFDSFRYLQPFPGSPASNCSSTFSAGKFVIDCSGQPLVNAPKVSLDLGLQQSFDLSDGSALQVDINGHHQSGSYTAINFQMPDYQDAYWNGDFSVTYAGSGRKWSAAAFVNNFTDATIKNNTNHTNVISSQLRAPRTFGLRLTAGF